MARMKRANKAQAGKQAKAAKADKSQEARRNGPRDSKGPESRQKAWAMMLGQPDIKNGQIAEKLGIKSSAIAPPLRWLGNLLAAASSSKHKGAKALEALGNDALGEKGKPLAEKYSLQFGKLIEGDAKLAKAFAARAK